MEALPQLLTFLGLGLFATGFFHSFIVFGAIRRKTKFVLPQHIATEFNVFLKALGFPRDLDPDLAEAAHTLRRSMLFFAAGAACFAGVLFVPT